MSIDCMNYQLPSLDLLDYALPSESKEELLANARLLQQTLAQFDIEVALGDITKGPTITRFEFHVAPGVRMQRIQGLSNNLMAALQATSIRILAPIPGKSTVGVEMPNLVKTQVVIRDLLESEEWRNSTACLPIALGKEVSGHPIIVDLADMPHLLIAGSTGSGKSVCLNAIIISLLYRFSPDQLRLMLIDRKGVEFLHVKLAASYFGKLGVSVFAFVIFNFHFELLCHRDSGLWVFRFNQAGGGLN